jgi:hypothetical protein
VDADETLPIDGEQAIESNFLAGQVLKEISRLPETQREAVLLVYAGGRVRLSDRHGHEPPGHREGARSNLI